VSQQRPDKKTNTMKIKSLLTHRSTRSFAALCLATLLAITGRADAQDYQFKVVTSGLHRPTGIAIRGNKTIYFTEIPTPGVGGGLNAVKELNLHTNIVTTLHQGEPEPTNIAFDHDGTLYWTCKSAGVILTQDDDGITTPFLTGLARPSGITVDRDDNVYFTQLPTPRVPGGRNTVSVSDGTTTKVLHSGEPEPTDIVVAKDGDIYWTCKSAGVILHQNTSTGVTNVLAGGLNKPVGIALDHSDKKLYFTEIPTPGVSGANGGSNKVWEINLKTGARKIVHAGDPEPTDVTVAKNGNVYWTCSSAGVIVEASPASKGKK
jgi:sugar lactone lactonase YvrE